MKTRFFTLLMVLCLLTAAAIPAVSAETAPLFIVPAAVSAAPATTELVIGGVTVVISSVAAVEIGKHLGKTWDGVAENFNKFATDVGTELNKIFASWQMKDATSSEVEAMFAFEYYTATAGDGGKKDDKWYHKAKLENGKKVKVNTERISEEEAAKELKAGRDIFTSTKELAKKLVERVSTENKIVRGSGNEPVEMVREDIELHGQGQKGYYEHYHPKYQNTRPHCWFWKR